MSGAKDLMNNENLKKGALKQKVTHEFWELVWVFLYLAVFLFVLSTYRMLLLDEFHVKYFTYGAALVTALVVSKVILLGEYAGLGKRYEHMPLVFSAIYKAFLFGLLVAAFHFLEELIKRFLHGM